MELAFEKGLNAALAAEDLTEVSERLPWWKPERGLKPATGRAYVDVRGFLAWSQWFTLTLYGNAVH